MRVLVNKTVICGEEIKMVHVPCRCSFGMCNGAKLYADEEEILNLDCPDAYAAIADLISTVNQLRKDNHLLKSPADGG